MIVTFTAAWQKIFSPVAGDRISGAGGQAGGRTASGRIGGAAAAQTQTLIFNARLDAVVCGVFMVSGGGDSGGFAAALVRDSARHSGSRVVRGAVRAVAVALGGIMRELLRNLLGILREIGDQNAYARHLASRGVKDSAEEWRRFSDERFRAKYQRAKCC